MIPISKIKWGPDNALARDKKFADKWVEPDDIRICIEESNWIVSGEKGSGKSAISRALMEIHRDRFDVAAVVDYNGLTFSSLYKNIVAFARTTQLDRTVTLSQYWQFSIIVELIKESARIFPNDYGGILRRSMQLDKSNTLHDRLLKLMERAWNRIDEMTKDHVSQAMQHGANLVETGGITAEQLSELGRFPINDKYQEVKAEFFSTVERTGHKIMLVMDGLDTIDNRDIDNTSIGLIFSSLVDATINLKNDAAIPDGIFLKIIIPHDRYIALKLRDSDKVDLTHASIRWNSDTLANFLQRRIEVSTSVSFPNFQSAWRNILPAAILNKRYNLSEDSFDYIIRHTMYRPRQLQIHLERLSKKYPGALIEANMIGGCVAEACSALTRYFVNEYSIDHPNLARLLLLFDRKPNVMEFKAFREIISTAIARFIQEPTLRPNVDDKIDSLYVTGFFGILHFIEPNDAVHGMYVPPTKESRRHYVDFFYKNPRYSIVGTLRDDSLVALHPVFVDGANLRPHPSLIVG